MKFRNSYEIIFLGKNNYKDDNISIPHFVIVFYFNRIVTSYLQKEKILFVQNECVACEISNANLYSSKV